MPTGREFVVIKERSAYCKTDFQYTITKVPPNGAKAHFSGTFDACCDFISDQLNARVNAMEANESQGDLFNGPQETH